MGAQRDSADGTAMDPERRPQHAHQRWRECHMQRENTELQRDRDDRGEKAHGLCRSGRDVVKSAGFEEKRLP